MLLTRLTFAQLAKRLPASCTTREIYLFSKPSIPALGPTLYPQWVLEIFSPELRWREIQVTTHLDLVMNNMALIFLYIAWCTQRHPYILYTAWCTQRRPYILHLFEIFEIFIHINIWFLHLQRMPPNRIPLKSYHYRPQGRRTIGWLKKLWREQL